MLTLYIANGVIGDGGVYGSNVVTPPERTITLTRDVITFRARQQLDPSDVMDYVIDFTGLLATAERVAEIGLSLRPAAIGVGFQIRQVDLYAPAPIGGTKLRIWVSIDPEHRGDAIWATAQACAFDIDVTTDSVPPRDFQRCAIISVLQK